MNWNFKEPVNIIFGKGRISELKSLTEKYKKPLLVCDPYFVKSGLAEKIKEIVGGAEVFCNVSPNPDVSEVNRCTELIKTEGTDVIIAVGGGSSLDLAKAASVKVEKIEECYAAGVPCEHLPVIAVPTTAGTGSETTCVSVLTDRRTGRKAPLNCESFYPQTAVIDPELTYTVPPYVTASCGLDVLCHAVEGYWSRGHLPVCDALAVYAVKTVFRNLPKAVKNGQDEEAREKMAEASVMAGLAFNLPKTTASHACSFPLTSLYHIPHGEACALTLDFFTRVNEKDERVRELAAELGYENVSAFADDIARLKKEVGLRMDLADLNLSDEQVCELVRLSHHPNLKNNPVEITDEILFELYNRLRRKT